jgi:hypothetical protein
VQFHPVLFFNIEDWHCPFSVSDARYDLLTTVLSATLPSAALSHLHLNAIPAAQPLPPLGSWILDLSTDRDDTQASSKVPTELLASWAAAPSPMLMIITGDCLVLPATIVPDPHF